MTREEKAAVIEDLKSQLADNPTIYLTDISGLDAGTTSALRRACFKANIKLAVVKNTLLKKAMEKVGKEGVITVEEAKSMETSLDVVEGMRFDRGYLSPYFVTDAERMEAVLQREVLFFRTLFRNTTASLVTKAPGDRRLVYGESKWLWLFAIIFHYAFLVVVIRIWGGMPEGVMYAILLANAVSPHIDSAIQPTVYGTRGKEAKS